MRNGVGKKGGSKKKRLGKADGDRGRRGERRDSQGKREEEEELGGIAKDRRWREEGQMEKNTEQEPDGVKLSKDDARSFLYPIRPFLLFCFFFFFFLFLFSLFRQMVGCVLPLLCFLDRMLGPKEGFLLNTR